MASFEFHCFEPLLENCGQVATSDWYYVEGTPAYYCASTTCTWLNTTGYENACGSFCTTVKSYITDSCDCECQDYNWIEKTYICDNAFFWFILVVGVLGLLLLIVPFILCCIYGCCCCQEKDKVEPVAKSRTSSVQTANVAPFSTFNEEGIRTVSHAYEFLDGIDNPNKRYREPSNPWNNQPPPYILKAQRESNASYENMMMDKRLQHEEQEYANSVSADRSAGPPPVAYTENSGTSQPLNISYRIRGSALTTPIDTSYKPYQQQSSQPSYTSFSPRTLEAYGGTQESAF